MTNIEIFTKEDIVLHTLMQLKTIKQSLIEYDIFGEQTDDIQHIKKTIEILTNINRESETDKLLNELHVLTQVEWLNSKQTERYVFLYEYFASNNIEIPFEVSI